MCAAGEGAEAERGRHGGWCHLVVVFVVVVGGGGGGSGFAGDSGWAGFGAVLGATKGIHG